MAKTLVALEITEESVRAIEITAGRTNTVLALGEVPLPKGVARDSEVLDADAVAVALRQLWTQARIKGRHVVLSVGSRRILIREFSTAAMSLDLIKASLPYQVQDLIPVPATQAVLDFYPVSEAERVVSGLLVAAVSETIEDLIAAVSRAKLVVTRVDLGAFGLANVQRAVAAAGETSAVVYVDVHTTYVVVATDGVPVFARVIPVDVAVPRSEPAESVFIEEPELVLAAAAPVRGRSAMRASAGGGDPGVLDLASRVRSTLSFYEGRPGAAPVRHVALSGPGTLVPGLEQTLGHAVDVPLRTIDLSAIGSLSLKGAVDPMLARNLVSTVGVLLGGEN